MNNSRAPLLTLALVCAALPRSSPQDAKPAPTNAAVEVGKPAPAFALNDHTGRAVRVGGKAPAWTILAFYPKAATPG